LTDEVIKMRRREFIVLVGGAAAAWPLAGRGQQAMSVVGFLSSYSSSDAFAQYFLAAFHQGLKQAGYVEGQNVAVEYRWAGNEYERLTALAAVTQHPLYRHILAVGPDRNELAT
jgi:putative tryptophan/tyrosine transport system substrate-binding protein